MSKRLEILTNSLTKKEDLFSKKLDAHFADVKRGNGQPMNDKRNGRSTMNRWQKQDNALRAIKDGIAKTKDAIQKEEYKIDGCNDVKESLPAFLLQALENGDLIQWRRHPTTFFVKGVEKARLFWNGKMIFHRYVNEIPNAEQHKIFAIAFNNYKKLNIEVL